MVELHPDRLLPADAAIRPIARRLHASVRDLPIVSPHGHVDPAVLRDDLPFPDPVTLLVTPDHYVTRLLHADGVDLTALGVGEPGLPVAAARRAWREVCRRWRLFRGTPVRYWLEVELGELFGVTDPPSAETADRSYDAIAERLADAEFRPRALYRRFGIDVLATTDDPCSDLSAHQALADDPTWTGRVIPTFRPDRYLDADQPDWPALVAALGETADVDTASYAGWVEAMRRRRRYFLEHGATSADHSHVDVDTAPVPDPDRLYRSVLAGAATADEATALRRQLLLDMAGFAVEDGLTMTLHPGVRRSHHGPTARQFGPDTGHDIPLRMEFTDALRPLLERYGTVPGFHLVLFTLDESAFSREIAPLAGFYPSVYAGAPWWFLDAPDAIRRFRGLIGETAGFYRTCGFVDDTRAFCSIPARHDMSRRIDAGVLATLVAEHRLGEDEAAETLHDLVLTQPRKVFKL